MQARHAWPDSIDTNYRTLRSPSISSEVVSISAKSTNTTVPHANPPPAYIASSGASNLISSELDRTFVTSPQALILVNEFLDQVLFNILGISRSVSLDALRSAVPSVLKPRLGKAAVAAAEENLAEYIDDEEDIDLSPKRNNVESGYNFDLELAWKLARLRCMVYAELGDLEDEDEQEWLEKEQLLEQVNHFAAENDSQLKLDPSSAIFLASVIEYLGQQALMYAAQHALRRHDSNKPQAADGEQLVTTLTPRTDEIVLQGKDMNHVGRDSPLSRLWRSWRRTTRDNSSGLVSPEAILSPVTPSHSRTGSQVPTIHRIAEENQDSLDKSPAQMPLPIGENDIEEIEVPGLASALSDSEDDEIDAIDTGKRRPASMVVMPGAFPDSSLSDTIEDDIAVIPSRHPMRPFYRRQRSSSVPASRTDSFRVPKAKVVTNAGDSTAEIIEPAAEQMPVETTDAEAPLTPPASQRRRGHSATQDQDASHKRDGMIGGGLAAAVGALGAGTAVSAAIADDSDMEPTNEPQLHVRQLAPPSPPQPQKRTAAEEMLGTHDPVSPPRDASTGASITNVSDFDSMYVPVEMPTGHNDFTDRYSAYGNQTAAPAPVVRKAIPQHLSESERYGDHRVSALDPSTIPAARNRRPSYGLKTSPSDVRQGEVDSPVSPEMYQREAFTPAYIDGQAQESAQSRRLDPLHSNPVQHAHTGSEASLRSHDSKSSSSSSRLLGFTRDPSGRPHTLSQQYAAPPAIDNHSAGYSSAPSHAERDGRPLTANSAKNKPLPKIQGLSRSEEDQQKKQSLEVLIRGDETLHYTLTPAAAMRDPEPIAAKRKTATQDMADFTKSTAPPHIESYRSAQTPITTNQIAATKPLPGRALPTADTPRRRGAIPSSKNIPQIAPSPYRRRNPMGEARDARAAPNMVMRDLADYARSTGPVNESQLAQALSPGLPAAANNQATFNRAARPVSTVPRFQARDARSKVEDNSDLIDFIREGPPRNPGEHRIDRRVAPFRTTMDSEDLRPMAPNVEEAPGTYETPSTYGGQSADTSINSRTALLNANHRTAGGPARQLEENGMPQRTRRRVRDPYAISDSEDEEDYDARGRPQKPSNNEESLIDFLRNTAPPPGMATQPIFASVPAGQRMNEAPSNSIARETSPHLTQSGSKMDSFRPTQPTYAPHVDRARTATRPEAREARPMRTGTSDLADFFANSGPPPGANEPQPIYMDQAQSSRDGNGLFRSFTKRKK